MCQMVLHMLCRVIHLFFLFTKMCASAGIHAGFLYMVSRFGSLHKLGSQFAKMFFSSYASHELFVDISALYRFQNVDVTTVKFPTRTVHWDHGPSSIVFIIPLSPSKKKKIKLANCNVSSLSSDIKILKLQSTVS